MTSAKVLSFRTTEVKGVRQKYGLSFVTKFPKNIQGKLTLKHIGLWLDHKEIENLGQVMAEPMRIVGLTYDNISANTVLLFNQH